MHRVPSNILREEAKRQLDLSGLSHRLFEQSLGLKHNALKGLLDAGAPRVPSVDNAQIIAEALGLDMYLGPPRQYAPEVPVDTFLPVPRYDVALSAGPGQMADTERQTGSVAFRADWLSRKGISSRNACVLTARGDSMAPLILDGDILLIDRSRQEVRNGVVYGLVDADGAARVKRLELLDHSLLLRSDNPEHSTEILDRADADRVMIIGQVLWFGRDFDQSPKIRNAQ